MLTVSHLPLHNSSQVQQVILRCLFWQSECSVLISNRYRPHKYPSFQFSTRVFLYQQKTALQTERAEGRNGDCSYMCIRTSALGTSNKTGHVKKRKPFEHIKARLFHL